MVKNILIGLIAVGSMVSMSSCSTLADARAGKGSGLSREYSAPFDVVWTTIPVVLAELSLPLVADNKQDGYILAQRGITAFSYGENVAIFVESVSGVTKTRVEVVSTRAMASNIFAPDWAEYILNKLDEKLK
jgi:hypothetical protein